MSPVEALSPAALRWQCTPAELAAIRPTDDRALLHPDAIEALRFGMEQSGRGLNVFLSGRPGTDRVGLIRELALHVRPRTLTRPDQSNSRRMTIVADARLATCSVVDP